MKFRLSAARIPSATYRLQFNRAFTFKQAGILLAYFDDLGISDLYSSPIFTAPPESNHGYDVCDYNQLNPVLGTENDWKQLAEKLRARKIGLLLDFVPNHMGASPRYNPWWRDILEYGVDSRFANFFDIDWNQPDLKNRILLPVLEAEPEKVLSQGLFKLELHPGGFQINYRGTPLPCAPGCYQSILSLIANRLTGKNRALISALISKMTDRIKEQLRTPKLVIITKKALEHLNQNSRDATFLNFMRALLERQAYRLAYWRTATHVANYRRFFNVDSLVATNMDRPEVFQAAHQLLGKLVRAKQVTGLRLDHIDGLADPTGYLKNLQQFLLAQAGVKSSAISRGFYVLVEKITMPGESLRALWPVFGTTGYEFTALAIGILIDPAQEKKFMRIYQSFTGNRTGFDKIVHQSKAVVMNRVLSKEMNLLTQLLKNCSAERQLKVQARDLKAAIQSVIRFFPRYRTYITASEPIYSEDRKILENSIRKARAENKNVNPAAYRFIKKILLSKHAGKSVFQANANLFRSRFQQFTGPIMAKSYEDTAFFIYNRLIALNEVGSNPARFGWDVAAFHHANQLRLKHEPDTMLTLSTHDTKLSEDARARVAALSEIPEHWEDFLEKATVINDSLKTLISGKLAPDRNEEYLFYQILLAIWPLEPLNAKTKKNITERVQRHLLKALREAKVNTRWNDENSRWENAVSRFAAKIIHAPSPTFSKNFKTLADDIAGLGAINSLSQTLLKLTVPGVPDLYQGNELWQFFLTDPDNRDPIDYPLRQKILRSLSREAPRSLMKNWRSGAIKMFLIRTVLRYRRLHPSLFQKGAYAPLKLSGTFKDNCLAFARTWGEQKLITVAPRLTFSIGFPPIGDCWQDTTLDTRRSKTRYFKNLFTGERFKAGKIPVAELFRELPFAILVND